MVKGKEVSSYNFLKSAALFSVITMCLVSFVIWAAIGQFDYITDGKGLTWNCFLSLVSFIFYCLFRFFYQKKKPFLYVPLFLFWLLFLPNSFYMLTDFKYLSNFDIKTFAQPLNSKMYWRSWLYLFAIVDAVMTGCAYGVVAIVDFEKTFLSNYGRVIKELIIAFLMFIIGCGVYIGRFVRLNSWDMFRPEKIINELLPHLDFNGFMYVLIFTYVSWMIYFLLRGMHFVLRESSSNHEN